MNITTAVTTLCLSAQKGNRVGFQGKNRNGKTTLKILWWGTGRAAGENPTNVLSSLWKKKGEYFKKRTRKMLEGKVHSIQVFHFDPKAEGRQKWALLKTVDVEASATTPAKKSTHKPVQVHKVEHIPETTKETDLIDEKV